MTTRAGDGWPVAELDGLARLRTLATALPGVFLHERHIAHPPEDVWRVATDFEELVPIFEPDVSSIRILSRDGERVELLAHAPRWAGRRAIRFDAEVRPGWCWMVARRPRAYVIGMAAEPDGDGTRFGHLEGVTLPAPRWAAPLVRPILAVSGWRHRHHVPRDVDGIERLL